MRHNLLTWIQLVKPLASWTTIHTVALNKAHQDNLRSPAPHQHMCAEILMLVCMHCIQHQR